MRVHLTQKRTILHTVYHREICKDSEKVRFRHVAMKNYKVYKKKTGNNYVLFSVQSIFDKYLLILICSYSIL